MTSFELRPFHAQIDERLADVLSALADPVRIRILLALQAGGASPQALAQRLGLPFASVIEHLDALWHARVVTTELAPGGRRYLAEPAAVVAAVERLWRALASASRGPTGEHAAQASDRASPWKRTGVSA